MVHMPCITRRGDEIVPSCEATLGAQADAADKASAAAYSEASIHATLALTAATVAPMLSAYWQSGKPTTVSEMQRWATVTSNAPITNVVK